MKDNSYELFPIVNKNGNFLGSMSRGHAHDGSKELHPVVHLHIFNNLNEIYLQQRPKWKDIQPGKWDTACGGHVDLGEHIEEALYREVREELSINNFTPKFVTAYAYESDTEYELINIYFCQYDEKIIPNKEELSNGKFWSVNKIMENIGKEILTPNFENEFITYVYPYLESIM